MKANKLIPLLRRGDGSTLSLDFTTMGSLDSRFTFTRASTATYINSSGLVTTMAAASTNDPTKARFDYDPTTLAPRGLLIEGSATNLLTHSSEYSTGSWFVSGYTIGTGATSPDGASAAQRWTANSGSISVGSRKQVAAFPSTSVTFSIFWKNHNWTSSTPQQIKTIALRNDTTATIFRSFYIDNPTSDPPTTVNGTGSGGVTLVKYPNGWWRIVVTHSANITAGDNISIYVGGLYVTVTGAGEACDWWGAQLEAGSGASSYIPTGASTVQRAAESCSIAASPSWLNTSSGTFLATWSRGDIGTSVRTAVSTDYVAGRLLSLNNTNTTGTVVLDWWSGAISRTTGSSSNKAAYTYGQTTGSGNTLQLPVRLCVNGSAVATGTFGNGTSNGADVPNPVNWTNFVIGAASSGAPYITATRDWLNNCIRSIKYWPTVLPDATLQNLTQ